MKRRDLKILFHTNAPWSHSGYSVEAKMLIKRMITDGWKTACSCNFGLQGSYIEWGGIPCYPTLNDPYGSDAVGQHAKDFGAHIIIPFQDIWTLNPQALFDINQKGYKIVPYCPIDKDPVPPNVASNLRFSHRIITFSRFGHKTLEDAGLTSTLILEGTDVNIYKSMDQQEMRKKYNIRSDVFVFGMIAANKENPPRKGFQEAIEAFKLFHDRHNEAVLIIHSNQVIPSGFPIVQFAQHLNIQKSVLFIADYNEIVKSSNIKCAEHYNTFDVLLHPSQTEGFGLTVIEAGSCGKLAIVNDSTSMPEMIVEGKTGFICKRAGRRFVNDLSYVDYADVPSLYECMEKAYKLVKEHPEKTMQDCRDHIMKNYNIDTIYNEKWVKILTELQDEIIPLNNEKTSSNISIAG